MTPSIRQILIEMGYSLPEQVRMLEAIELMLVASQRKGLTDIQALACFQALNENITGQMMAAGKLPACGHAHSQIEESAGPDDILTATTPTPSKLKH